MHALRDTVCAIAQPASATLGHVAAATVGAAARPKRVRMGRLCARALFRASPFRETPEARLAAAAVGQAIVGARAPGYRLEAVRFLRGAALGWLALFGLERSYALELLERVGIPVRGNRERLRPSATRPARAQAGASRLRAPRPVLQ